MVLVPSIALVSQTKREFQKLARRDGISIQTLAVCSDATAGRVTHNAKYKHTDEEKSLAENPAADISNISSFDVVGETATNETQVIDWLIKHNEKSRGKTLGIFSTYQSSHHTANGLIKAEIKANLMICDEAHRTAGIKKIPKGIKDNILKNFTLCHEKDLFPATYRLYQTATPRVYSNVTTKQPLIVADDSNWDVRSMNDISTFGPELYRLSYVSAVKRGLLSDYRIIAWGLGEKEAIEAQHVADELNKTLSKDSTDGELQTRWDRNMAMRALTLAAFLAGCVQKVPIKSVIAFCNRVKISSELAEAVTSKPVQDWLRKYFKRLKIEPDPAKFHVKHVDASYQSSERNDVLYQLGEASAANPFCITNVGIFGEGTDSPDLSAVAFLNPRKSPVDVIQAVGRAMRKSSEKEFGFILVPVLIPENHDPESFLRNSAPQHGWEELGQILQALRAHDGRIEDELESLMEFYIPPPAKEDAKHLVVVKEFAKPPVTYLLTSTSPTMEQVISPKGDPDSTTIEDRLNNDRGSLEKITDLSKLDTSEKPKSISAIVRDKDQRTFIHDLTYTAMSFKSEEFDESWDPQAAIEIAIEFIRKDRQRKKKKMRIIPPRPRKKIDHQRELGLRLLHLEKDTLAETGIQLNLLEKSGILRGARRDVNLLEGTVKVIARKLHEEQLEDLLSTRLGMQSMLRTSGKEAADACTVTAVIWLNAAIMHARLEKSSIRQLQTVSSLQSCVSNVMPARGLMEAWRKVLIKDYVPIFEIAVELLEDVAFRNLECVSDALSHLAKSAIDIAEQYANLGMDHAGELFNKVMGNQKSEGAFFTRPISATMLAELALQASGFNNWLDEKSWDQLRCFDPSCGSGTLLVAMMTAIKRHIRLAGGDAKLLRRFHRRAVENLIVGADVNHVSLQLAACQLTLGEIDVTYDKMNLHLMEYGVNDPDSPNFDAKTGTLELLLDEGLFPSDEELQNLRNISANLGLNMIEGKSATSLGEELVDSPPSFMLMNPPYTSWTSVGKKFDRQVQLAVRDRLSDIWDEKKSQDPMLSGKKSSIATLFDALAIGLMSKTAGIIGAVRPLTVITSEDSREFRKQIAKSMHVDFVLTCHHPTDFNLSWDTDINECLIILSARSEATQQPPTRFINFNQMPNTNELACQQVEQAVSGLSFNGSSILWDYEYIEQGDWSPAVFSDCILADLTDKILSDAKSLTYDVINSNSSVGGGRWRPTRFDI